MLKCKASRPCTCLMLIVCWPCRPHEVYLILHKCYLLLQVSVSGSDSDLWPLSSICHLHLVLLISLWRGCKVVAMSHHYTLMNETDLTKPIHHRTSHTNHPHPDLDPIPTSPNTLHFPETQHMAQPAGYRANWTDEVLLNATEVPPLRSTGSRASSPNARPPIIGIEAVDRVVIH